MGGDFTTGKQQDTRKGIYALAGKFCKTAFCSVDFSLICYSARCLPSLAKANLSAPQFGSLRQFF